MENTLFVNNEITKIQEGTVEKIFERYLLQIHRIKLQDYIQCGLVAPDIYLGDEIEKDIQSNTPNCLIFSDGYIEELDESQILIDLILTEDEKASLHICEDVCYFTSPLPITRIKKVYAYDKASISHIVTTLQTSEKGFLPENIFESYMQKKQCIFAPNNYSPAPEMLQITDFSEQIRSFDKRMGMFAYMKNAKAYYCNDTGEIANYSKNYFKTRATLFNNSLNDGPTILNENSSFKALLYSKEQIDQSFIRTIAQSIEDNEIKELFLKILEPNSTRKILPLLLEKNAELYYFIALVFYVRQKDSNRKDSIKSNIKDIIPEHLAEKALAILGIYFGYRSLRTAENIEIHDSYFAKLFGKEWHMKFKLDSKLDYVIIESLYLHSFKDKNDASAALDYLDYPNPRKPMQKPNDKEFNLWYEFSAEEIDTAQYIKVRKKSDEAMIEQGMSSYNDEIVLGKDHLLSYIAKWFKHLLSYSKLGRPTEPFAKKKEVIDELKQKASTIKISELLTFFELDKKL